jgi:integration host factor subunit beta
MTKSQLIERVTDQLLDQRPHYKKRDVECAVNALFDSIKSALVNGHRVEVRGLGTFKVKQRDARNGRNPRNGESVDIPDRQIPFFKAGRELKELLNQD